MEFGASPDKGTVRIHIYKDGESAEIPKKVAIQAEGDYVTLSFAREYVDPGLKDETYTTTWFDMFGIVNGKIVEHWDSATKGPGPTRAPARG